MPAIILQIEGILRKFAQKARKNVTMHFVSGPGFAPLPVTRHHVHFVVGAAPPGHIDQIQRSHVCGIRLHERGHYISMWGPTKGYGVLIEDDKDTVAQIVGPTIYLYIPSPTNSSFLFEGDEGRELYFRTIAFVWKHRAGKGKNSKTPTREVADLDSFRRYMAEHKEFMPQGLTDKLLEIDKDIAKYTDKLRGFYAEKQIYVQLHDLERKRAQLPDEIPIEVEWKRIRGKKLIKRIFWVDRALHVETRVVIAKYKNKRFNLGRFMVRLPVGGTPSVWALSALHPKRIAHPHISEKGIVCFGNIAAPLAQAAGESRLADELDLLLGWLVEGYDPAIAETKIEEWPQVNPRSKRRRVR